MAWQRRDFCLTLEENVAAALALRVLGDALVHAEVVWPHVQDGQRHQLVVVGRVALQLAEVVLAPAGREKESRGSMKREGKNAWSFSP